MRTVKLLTIRMCTEKTEKPGEEGPQAKARTISDMKPPRVTKRKDIVRKSAVPNRIKSIEFGIASAEDIAGLAHIEVNSRDMYDQVDRSQVRGGALDPRLGAISKRDICETCKEKQTDCIGHFGYIRLALPVFHAGYFKVTLKILQMICKHCSRIMMDPELRPRYAASLKSKTAARAAIFREIWEQSKKVKTCPYCQRANGTVKKTAILKIVHYPRDNKPPARKKDDDEDGDENQDDESFLMQIDPAFLMAAKENLELRKHILKAADDLHPMRVLQLFEKIPPEDVCLLDMNPDIGRPERMILQYLPVPPLCIRPTVCADPSAGSTEDDLTIKACEIVNMNTVIAHLMSKGGTPSNLFESWDQLQYEVARYINSEQPGLPLQQGVPKPLRGVSQRLKGKTGRFRGNLSGKRVDFSGRTVISPDPNLRIDEVGVPVHVAKVLSYPDIATSFNMERLRKAVRNGPDTYPGANFVQFPDGNRRLLKYANRDKIAKELNPGTIVERHLINGDIVLFNRQPSLHRISIMSHRVRISPHRTFRFNECVCGPYNADFDGDEMNLHVPQTEEARAEAIELMGVVNNILTPKNGEPLVAATQDFITASYLVTSKNTFMDRAEFTRVASMISDAAFSIPVPPPAILKPVALWTGKQLYSAIIQSSARSAGASEKSFRFQEDGFRDVPSLIPSMAYISTEVAEKGFKSVDVLEPYLECMCSTDSYVVVQGGELLCGQVGKKSLGDGTKKSILYILLRECGNEAAAYAMNRIARFSARWHSDGAFSIGIDDVTPSLALQQSKAEVVSETYEVCDEYLEQHRAGKLPLQPGLDSAGTLEKAMVSELNGLRKKTGDACIQGLDVHTNAALTMALAGSKGSVINIAQMVACVGQQVLGGDRCPDGFFGRALPHFELGLRARAPLAKGFVANSFFSGLTGTEFFMHAQSGREGLTDTAVKTAETGYMQRRLMKALEDLSVQYDSTVRASNGSIVQMCYGDDGLDPMLMETDDDPVDFDRLLTGVRYAMKRETDPMLTPSELRECTAEVLADWRTDMHSSKLIPPRHEDNRGGLDFCISRVESFWMKKAREQEECRSSYGWRKSHVKEFVRKVEQKVRRSAIQPGTAVGAVGGQSIGEPGTQMTLKTFHFAGVASMNITQGVPRLKEIINASKAISTPVTSAPLVWDHDVTAARIVQGRVEKTALGAVVSYIKEVYRSRNSYVAVKLDMETIRKVQLDITLESVAERIVRHTFSKLRVTADGISLCRPDKLRIRPYIKAVSRSRRSIDITKEAVRESKKEMEGNEHFLLQLLKQQLPTVPVCGINSVDRAVINQKDDKHALQIASASIRDVMVVPGIRGTEVSCNHIMAMEKTLGIEAARYSILHEINETMSAHGLQVASHHLKLLADCMTSSGAVLGITRFGIQKMRTSTLMLASFEMTVDHLFHAAIHSKQDEISGVSERIIMGVPIPLGTGLFQLLHKTKSQALSPEATKRDILLHSTTSFRVNS